MNKIINRIIIAVLIISGFLMFEMANIMFGQSARIQMLKQRSQMKNGVWIL